jgi:membrane protease YdiL (CAAX protease family)
VDNIFLNEAATNETPIRSEADPDTATLLIVCWRCGRQVEATRQECQFCRAPLALKKEPHREAATADNKAVALLRVIIVFMIILSVSVVSGLTVRNINPSEPLVKSGERKLSLAQIVVFEAIDSVLVLCSLFWIKTRFIFKRKPIFQHLLIGACFILLLGCIVAINVGYHRFLYDIFHFHLIETRILPDRDLMPLWILVICVQPAIIEEIFFRYLALGTLRSVVGVHTAVFITAVMFGMAHIGVPLSIPILFLIGLGLGYARIVSGSMVLPILMHFLHNLAILAFSWMLLKL